MKFLCGVLLAMATSSHAATFTTHGVNATAWTLMLGSVGLHAGSDDSTAAVIVLGPEQFGDLEGLAANHIVIAEGWGEGLKQLGFERKDATQPVRHITDLHAPKAEILWSDAAVVPRLTALPAGMRVFATEKWTGAAVMAGKRTAHGALLWVATSPGPTGMERYPYLLQAAVDLGLELPAHTASLWAFFDSAYRIRADVEYLAKRWRATGISVLHAAAWHNVEPDGARDEYLARLIAACHRNGILVYAWLELPHVSEQFWDDHPEWREKTAVGQDAQLDWRKLMNLSDPDCRRAVGETISGLLSRFDWDGVNLAELYFESLEGASNPARFTPMNESIRAEFARQAGFDPKVLFDPSSPFAAGRNPQGLRKFLDYRANLTSRMQAEWMAKMDEEKRRKPYLDVVLTHIDDRFEPGMRDALGADVARTLPVLEKRRETLLVEDPATLWNLGPDRYAKLAEKYRELSARRDHLAVDINVVERYQDVYPTKKQTGVELFELVHQAATSFRRVALYIENSLEKQDVPLLPVAACVSRVERTSVDEWSVDGQDATRVMWSGPAELDGKQWPVQNREFVLVPPGKHRLRPGLQMPALTIADFNGEIRSVSNAGQGQVHVSYMSRSRALAAVRGDLGQVELDGWPMQFPAAADGLTHLALPAGQHLLTLTPKPPIR